MTKISPNSVLYVYNSNIMKKLKTILVYYSEIWIAYIRIVIHSVAAFELYFKVD